MLHGVEVEPISSPTSPFRVIFDPHRARPHFLLVWKDEETNMGYIDVMQIPPIDLISLLSCAQEVTQAMGLEELSILSLHQGSFARPENCSNVHLLVKPDKYLEEFRKKDPDPSKYEMVAQKVDEWFDISTVKNGKWKNEDLTDLYYYIEQQTDEMENIPNNYSHFFRLAFHSTQPRIGFTLEDDNKDEVLLLRVMAEFIEDQKISGSHMCVCLSKSLTVYDEEFGSARIKAYLQVHIQDYYRINPNRQKWLEKFKLPETEYTQYT